MLPSIELWSDQLSQASEGMLRQVDRVTAVGRGIALLPALAFALLGPASAFPFGRWTLVIVTLAMALVDLVPIVLLSLDLYPRWAALGFVALDTVYALVVLGLGGSIFGFYAFVPILALGARFDWPFGVADALILAIGCSLILIGRAASTGTISGLNDILELGVAHWTYLAALLLSALLGGQLFESIKREPPLNADEIQARQREITRWCTAAERGRAVYELASTLSATLNPDTILDAVLDVCMAGLQELDVPGKDDQVDAVHGREGLPSAVFLYRDPGLYVAAARGIDHRHRSRVTPGTQGLLGQVLEGGEPIVCGALDGDSELTRFAPLGRCLSAVGVPFRSGFEVYGAVVLGSFVPNAFDAEHVDLLSAVSNQAAAALTNARLYSDLQREKEHILEVEEKARGKLARDLHDGPTQAVSAIAMRLNYARLLLGRDPARVRNELFSLENLARRTTKDIRTLLFTLRPLVLETQGLKIALEKLVEQFTETCEIKVTLDLEDLGQLDMNTQTVAWYVTEECLTNVRKHAKAQNVTIKMCVQEGFLVGEIEDDGVGFDFESVMEGYEQSASYGLLGLQERAELVNGRTTISSLPGGGTKVTLSVPLSQEVA
jgi:signal transduction histidine kinase